MRLVPFNQWASQDRVPVEDDAMERWAGITIGPDSDEARVRIDDRMLQAGIVLPLQARRFALSRVRPQDAQLASIQQLQIALLEPSEITFSYRRPAVDKSSVLAIGAGATATASFPFVGRRQAAFVLQSDDMQAGKISYSVWGLRWSFAKRKVVYYELKTETPTFDTSTPQGEGSPDNSYAFDLGGTNEAEPWDVIRIDVTNAALAACTVNVDFQGLGEIGAL